MELQMLAAHEYSWTSEADPIRYYRLPVVGWFFRRRVARCISLLPPGKRVLEIGYGSGVSFLNLGRKFRVIDGVDVHDSAAEVARSFSHSGLSPRLRKGSIASLPYENASFDAALAISVHEELDPALQSAAFSEVRRVLRPGGCYVVGVPGVNPLMNSALQLLGCDVAKYHVCTDYDVRREMTGHFDVDVARHCPRFWPAKWTTYLCLRGWKR